MPIVSVIVPNFNHAAFLDQRLSSIFNQTFKDFEVIILDDCSTDHSRDVIERYRGNKQVSAVVFNESNSGSTFKQWKKGIELSRGQFIWIAESDDVAELGFLAQVMADFEKDKDIVLSYCLSNIIDEKGNFLYPWTKFQQDFDPETWQTSFVMNGCTYLEQYLSRINTIPNASAVVFKKSSYQASFLHTDLRYCGDWLFWWNLLLVGNVSYSSHPQNNFRRHANTVTRMNTKEFQAERLCLIRYFFRSPIAKARAKELFNYFYFNRYRIMKSNPLSTFATILYFLSDIGFCLQNKLRKL